ncbi:MAG: phosphate transport system regulatory protein PhoU [Planctomycetaceae bacterium]|nr:phosphate transport system regulatory protein PhoU [Planctomycetaceae bacterium]
MSIHLERDLEILHHDILHMCSVVEEMIHRAVSGLRTPSLDLAGELAEADNEIDRMDVQIEDACLKILALHQPVAIDLRRISTVLKIGGELERVADLSVNIAERGAGLVGNSEIVVSDRLQDMAHLALQMLHRSIDSYVELDSTGAREILAEDDRVDQLNAEIIAALIDVMRTSPFLVEPALHLFSATRHIERVADHATNIAEDVVFMVDGVIIRHRSNAEISV